MSTHVRRTDGGYATFPNRWIDAGYMAKSPGSVTQVYLFLCRWADNESFAATQPLATIARKTGLTEDVARKAVRILEAWGVVERESQTGPAAKNTWTLNQLMKQAPDYPDKVPPKLSTRVVKSTTPTKSGPYQPEGSYQPEGEDIKQPEDSSLAPTRKTGGAHDLINAFCDEIGIRTPTNYPKAIGQASKLLKAGATPDTVKACTSWLINDPYWHEKGVDIGIVLSQWDKFVAVCERKTSAPVRVKDARGNYTPDGLRVIANELRRNGQ